jgi:preprotein translocase subunit YajC
MGIGILAAASKTSNGGSSFYLLFVIVALFVLMYFMAIRPQRNRQRRVQQTQNELQPGMRVRTTAGMFATITSLDGDEVVLEVAPGVEVRFLRRAVMDVVSDAEGFQAAPLVEDETDAEAGHDAGDEVDGAGDEAVATGDAETDAAANDVPDSDATQSAGRGGSTS